MKITDEQLVSEYCRVFHLDPKTITYDMIIKHWNLERELAKRMLASNSNERIKLFNDCYKQLYECCAWFISQGGRSLKWANWWIYLLSKASNILELGGGFTTYAEQLAEQGHHVTGLDISEEKIKIAKHRFSKVNYVLGNCTDLPMPFPNGSFNAIFSNQMIEHLHPDDVLPHFKEMYRLPEDGGFYYFSTPNGLWGPNDISALFGYKKSAGLHLKEYTYSDVYQMLDSIGFKIIKTPAIHPLLSSLVHIKPPLINVKRKAETEDSLKDILHPLSYLISRSMAYREIFVIAIK